ncbi:MAG TPA: hypothetical protein DIS90_16425 [Cytophagales bacterium]|nr:hypothetical protein [Cytophagales bacterium]
MERDVAILMADLTGYTAMTDVHGGASAAKIVDKYMQLVDKACFGNCKVIQRIGDQVVMIADQAIDIALTAQRLNCLALKEHDFLAIHSGIHYGPVFEQNGNLFGTTINVASRIMNLAKRGQVVCSEVFLNEIQGLLPVEAKPIGTFKLKNVAADIALFELPNPIEATPFLPIDPVCLMHVDPAKSSFILVKDDQSFHFCSKHCLDLFSADFRPE